MVTLSSVTTKTFQAGPRIEVLGVFGAGKSTLAARVAGRVHAVLPEDHERNRFWGDDSPGMIGYLAYDLSFLLQHVHLAANFRQVASGQVAVCDWSLLSDRLWASMRLGSEFAIYDAVHAALTNRIRPAVGYLYLKQTPKVVLQRLRQRGRAPEANLGSQISEAVARLDALVRSLPSDLVAVVSDDLDERRFGSCVTTWLKTAR